VRETSDLVPILMHDTTLGRTTNDPNNRRVSDVSLAQIKLLDAGSWFSPEFEGEQIPTLEEALQVMAGRTKLFLELKTYSRSLELNSVALVEAYQMINDTVFLSFSREQIRRLKQINPEVQTLLLISTFYGDAEALARARDIDAYGLSEFFFLRNPEFVDLAHQQNKKIYVWTVNSDNAIRNVADRDADGIITDRPLAAREIVYARNTPDILLEILRRLFRPT
jgi:glycerophosphoryl diester phosphodiesterase